MWLLVIMQKSQEKADLQKVKVKATNCADRNKLRSNWERQIRSNTDPSMFRLNIMTIPSTL